MDKNNWIDDIVNSAGSIESVEPNTFLFEKTAHRIQNGKLESINLSGATPKTKWAFAMAAVLVIAVNVIVISKSFNVKTNSNQSVSLVSELVEELGYNTTEYNY